MVLSPHAWTQNDLQTLSEDFDLQWRLQRAEAESTAIRLGMPIRRLDADGSMIELQRFSLGRPIYYITDNVNAAATISSNTVHPGGAAGLSLTGSGITLGEWDGGGVRGSHQEFGGRVLTSQGTLSFHSTHVAGTMIAAGTSANAKGMSYEADLRAYDWNSDLSEMATQAASGLRASNHSYGIITGWRWNYFSDNRWAWFGDIAVDTKEEYLFGFYSTESANWDVVAHAAPHYLIVKSAGNDRNEGPTSAVNHWYWTGSGWALTTTGRFVDCNEGYDCVSGAAVSKNPLVVGAVHDIPGGYTTPASVVMSSFSAWGPTDDGRIKPDVVANGIALYSSFETADNAYGTISGTSMSTPTVTGSVGLLLQHQNNLHGDDSLLASTLKGLIIHTADEAGLHPGPDYRFGWGLMNTRKAAELMTLDSAEGHESHIWEMDMDIGDTILIDFASTGDEPLRATICWNDVGVGPPPAVLDPPNLLLRNDVDMRIIRKIDGMEFSPWILDPSNPADSATTGDNTRDNVEQILLDSPGRQLYTLRLTHKSPVLSPPMQISLVMSGNTDNIGPSMAVAVDSVDHTVIPGATLDDSITVYNLGDPDLLSAVDPGLADFWLSLTEDSLDIGNTDSAVAHYSIDGTLFSQWTTYDGTISFNSTDVLTSPVIIPVRVNVLGPTIMNAPGNFVIDLDSAEVGTDSLLVRNDGYIPLNVVVRDSSGALPSWITADPDTLIIAPGDSTFVVLTTNALNEPLGDYKSTLLLASNDSATGNVYLPIWVNIGTRTLFQLTTLSGWNIVSLPVEPITGEKTAIFPSVLTDAFGFSGGYYQADTLYTGTGYWLKFSGPQLTIVDGYQTEGDTVDLVAGWNLVGSITEHISVSSVTTDPSDILTSDFFSYAGGYLIADSITAGRGYWVQADQAGQMFLQAPPGAAPKSRPSKRMERFNSLTISDGLGNAQSLYFAEPDRSVGRSAMPPPSPTGGFDARFRSDRFVEKFRGGTGKPDSKTIGVRSSSEVITVTASVKESGSVNYVLRDAAGNLHRLGDGGEFRVGTNGSGTVELVLLRESGELPRVYALGQNYPNPFNPSTSISFDLPEDAAVSIILYNILGNEVATVVERRFEAGRHNVEFDAGDLPSGVYIYRMQADEFSSGRKMVLMR